MDLLYRVSIIQMHLGFIYFPLGLFSFFLVMLSVVIAAIDSYLNVTFPRLQLYWLFEQFDF